MNNETDFSISENQVSTRRKVILTYDEALDKIFKNIGTEILQNWSTNDLSMLLSNIMKFKK